MIPGIGDISGGQGGISSSTSSKAGDIKSPFNGGMFMPSNGVPPWVLGLSAVVVAVVILRK